MVYNKSFELYIKLYIKVFKVLNFKLSLLFIYLVHNHSYIHSLVGSPMKHYLFFSNKLDNIFSKIEALTSILLNHFSVFPVSTFHVVHEHAVLRIVVPQFSGRTLLSRVSCADVVFLTLVLQTKRSDRKRIVTGRTCSDTARKCIDIGLQNYYLIKLIKLITQHHSI